MCVVLHVYMHSCSSNSSGIVMLATMMPALQQRQSTVLLTDTFSCVHYSTTQTALSKVSQ
eukprot:6347-Heterococcus_DN1.PRE.2